MEIILIAIAIVVIGAFIFMNNKKPEVKQPDAPYKVETPPVVEPTPTVETTEEVKPVKKTAGRKPKAEKPAAKKPAARKTTKTKKSSAIRA